MDKVRFGVVGTNFISDWVIAGARQDERFELVAVYSRTQETADAFASKHNIPYTFTSLEEMAKSPLIDAVYIPELPSCLPEYSLHELWQACSLRETLRFQCERSTCDDRGFPYI